MSRREQIRMTAEEIEGFLAGPRTMNVASIGSDGRPHLVAMWYGFLGDDLAFWTYGKSQKALNMRRDPRITCLVEDGATYETLRGVEIIGTARISEDEATVLDVGESVFGRYTGPVDDGLRSLLKIMGQKRIAVRIDVERIVSWDHRKLNGSY